MASPNSGYAEQRFGLSGRTCLITGGTRGIGRAVAEEYCKLGARVFICSRNEADVADALVSLTGLGFDVQGMASDISIASNRLELLDKVKSAFSGQLHILVNNVGTNIRKPTLEYSEQEYHTLMSTNLEPAFHLCQLFQPLLVAAASSVPGGSVVLFNSSVAGGPTSMKSGSIYAMTKAALNQLTRNLACEWGALGVRVNSVAPWYTATDLANQVLEDPETREAVLSRTPMKRIGQPQEVAGLMAYLAGPAAAYVTGQTIAVDGGYSVMGFW